MGTTGKPGFINGRLELAFALELALEFALTPCWFFALLADNL